MIAVGIDPATGSSSPLGIFIYDTETLEIMFVANITYKHASVERRIKQIVNQLRPIFEMLEVYGEEVLIAFEYFVLKGKAGEMINRAIGGVITLIPDKANFIHVQNTSVKLVVGGTGKADKIQVAYGVKDFFKTNKESSEIIEHLINMQEFDIMDAAAIAITGVIQCKDPTVKKPKSKRKTTKKNH